MFKYKKYPYNLCVGWITGTCICRQTGLWSKLSPNQSSIIFQRRPALLRGVDLGPCREKWTLEHLRLRGGDKDVKIHVSTVPQMDFLHKNFVYKWALSLTYKHTQTHTHTTPPPLQISQSLQIFHRTLSFNEFLKRASEKKHSEFFLSEVRIIKQQYGNIFFHSMFYPSNDTNSFLGRALLSTITGRGRPKGI